MINYSNSVLNVQMVGIEYSPKDGNFHFESYPNEKTTPQGWNVLIKGMPINFAIDFTIYAQDNILKNKNQVSAISMRDEFNNWVELNCKEHCSVWKCLGNDFSINFN